jgi:arylsulfatase
LAASGDVFPLEDGSGVFFHQRPAFHQPDESATFWPGLPTIERIKARDLVWNRSFTVEARLGESAGHHGVIFAHGDQASGYQLHVDGGGLCFLVNAAGVITEIACGSIARDDVVVKVEISCPVLDRWDVAVTVDSQPRASRDGLWMRTGLMTPLHGIDIGLCRGSPVSWSIYERHGAFPWTGEIHSIEYRPGAFASNAPQLRVEEYRAVGLAVPGSDRAIPDVD